MKHNCQPHRPLIWATPCEFSHLLVSFRGYLVQMIEMPFQQLGPNQALAAAAFGAWHALIDGFRAAGQLANPKRVGLVVKAIYHPVLLNSHPAVLKVGLKVSLARNLSRQRSKSGAFSVLCQGS